MPDRQITITFLGDAKSAQKAMQTVADEGGKLSAHIKGLSSTIGTAAATMTGFLGAQVLGKAPGFFKDAAQAAADDAAATDRLNKALENYILAGQAAGTTAAEMATEINELKGDMDERIAAGQKLAFSDDEIRDSMISLIAATNDYGDAAKRQQAAMDLARGANIPLSQATKMLGKLNEENIEVFKRLGITIGENATEADALAAVQAKFGGQAETYAKSTAGQFEQAKIRMGELKEGIGAAVLPAFTAAAGVLVDKVLPAMEQFGAWFGEKVQPKIEAFVAWLGPQLTAAGEYFETEIQPRVEAFVAWLQPKLEEAARLFRDEVLPAIEELAERAGEEFEKFQGYYETDIKPAVDNIAAAVEWLIEQFEKYWPQISVIVKPILAQLANIVTTTVTAIKLALGIIIDLLGGDWSGAWNKTKELVRTVVEGWKATVENGAKLLAGTLGLFKAVGEDIIDNIRQGAREWFDNVLMPWVKGVPDKLKSALSGMWDFLWDAFKEPVNKIIDGWNGLDFTVGGGSFLGKDIPSFTLGTPDIPHLARGGVVVAGDNPSGIEAVVPLERAREFGFGNNVTVNVTINGDLLARSADEGRMAGRNIGFGIVNAMRQAGLA